MKYHWFKDFWQWWVALLWLIGFEAYAIITNQATLSRLVWRAYGENPWLQWPVAILSVGLLIHFFMRNGAKYPYSLLVMGILLVLSYVIRSRFNIP